MMDNPRPNPYVGPRAFETGEQLYGRDVETERLFNLLLAERIVLFYSPSGAGKTSLLQAALIPRLRTEGYRVSPALRVNEPLPAGVSGNRYVYSVLRALDEARPGEAHPAADRLEPAALASLTLGDYIAQREAATPAEDAPAGEVLLFDQFEEALTVNPTDQEAKTAFFAQVGAALRERHRWALFALREDYLAALELYLRVIPTRGKATFRLDLLGVDAARAALQEPARAAGVAFDEGAARQVVDDLRRVQVQQLDGSTAPALGPAVEPVQLQVVAYRLWESLPPGAERIGPDALAGLGDVNRALSDYYARSVARIAGEIGVSERAIREWVARQLITEQGRRDLVARGPESSGGLANAAIARLESAHLVRAEQRAGTTWYELAHDRLVEPLRADNAEWFAEHLSLLQRQAALWHEQNRAAGLLLSGDALAEAEAWAKDHAGELTEVERDFIAACRDAQARAKREQTQNRRIRWLAVGATFLMLLAVVAAVFALGQTQTAKSAQSTAVAERIRADQERDAAVAARGTAVAEGTRADQERDTALKAQAQAETAQREAARQARIGRITRARQLAAYAQADDDPTGSRRLMLARESALTTWLTDTAIITRSFVTNETLAALNFAVFNARQLPWRMTLPWRTRHTGSVRSVAYSPDGTRIVSGGADKTLRLWYVDIPYLLKLADSLIQRDPPIFIGQERSLYGFDDWPAVEH